MDSTCKDYNRVVINLNRSFLSDKSAGISAKRIVCGIPYFNGIASKDLLYSLNLTLQDWVEFLPSISLIILLYYYVVHIQYIHSYHMARPKSSATSPYIVIKVVII